MSSYNSEPEGDDDVSDWDLPNIEDTEAKMNDTTTNAFNIKPSWKYEPPDEQEEEIKPPTAEEIEAIRAAAFEEGFEEGKQKGLAAGHSEGLEKGHAEGVEKGSQEGETKGYEEGKQNALAIGETFDGLVQQLAEPLAQVNEEVKQQVTLLAVTLARAVIQTEIKTNEAIIATALEKGLEALPLNETDIQIHVNPDDFETIEVIYPKESQAEKGWKLVEKPSLSQGGCEVISTNNAVDVSVERRTRDVIDKFLLSHGLNNESA